MRQKIAAADIGSQSALAKQSRQRLLRRNAYGYLFIAPWLFGFLVFSLYPYVYSLVLSFTDYSMRPGTAFVGLQNYIHLITKDTLFRKSVMVTLHYVLLAVPLQLLFALALALLLNVGVPGLKYFRAAYYLPALMGGSVAIAVLWRQIFGAQGIFNQLLMVLGFSGAITSTSWISSPFYAIYSLILLRVWQFGSPMIIFLAGLKQIPAELYESASLDGASTLGKFRRITLPMLSPIILFNLIMQIISAFQTFTSAYIIGGTSSSGGGVANSLLFYTIYLYKMGFIYFKMGTASSLAWILLLIIAVFTVLIFRSSSYWVYYSDD